MTALTRRIRCLPVGLGVETRRAVFSPVTKKVDIHSTGELGRFFPVGCREEAS